MKPDLRVPTLLLVSLLWTEGTTSAQLPPDKQTALNIVQISGSDVSDVALETAEADRIYRKETTRKKILISGYKLVADPGGLLDLDEFTMVGTPTAEETTLLGICRVDPNDPTSPPCTVNVFFVRSLSGGSLGESFRDAANWGDDLEGSVVVATDPMEANSRTLAHELGHVLTDNGGHSPDAGNLMKGVAPVGDDLDTAGSPGQSAAIRMSRYCCDCPTPIPLLGTLGTVGLYGALLLAMVLVTRTRNRRVRGAGWTAAGLLLIVGLRHGLHVWSAPVPLATVQGEDAQMLGIEWHEGRAALARMGAQALPVAERYLDHPDTLMVRRAVILLGDLAAQGIDIAPYGDRFRAILRQEGPVLRADVIRTLGRTGDTSQADLVRAFTADPDYLVRERSAEALGRIGDPDQDVVVLETMAGGDDNPAVRKAALEALEALGR